MGGFLCLALAAGDVGGFSLEIFQVAPLIVQLSICMVYFNKKLLIDIYCHRKVSLIKVRKAGCKTSRMIYDPIYITGMIINLIHSISLER